MGRNSDFLRKGWDDGVYISQRNIWVQEDLNIYEKILWMCLEKFANGKDTAWPSRSTLAKECSMSTAQVKRTLNNLIEKGLLEKKIRKNGDGSFKTNQYTIFLPNQGNGKQTSGGLPQTLGVGPDRIQGVGSARPQGRLPQNPGVGSDRPQGGFCQTPKRKRIEPYKEQQRKDLNLEDLDLEQITREESDTENAVVVLPKKKNVKNQKPLFDKNTNIDTKEASRVLLDVGCKKMVFTLVKFGVDRQKAEQLAQTYDAKRIQQVLLYTQFKKPSSASGYIIRALENNWNIPEVAAQAEEKKDLLKEQTRIVFNDLKLAEKNAVTGEIQKQHIVNVLSCLKSRL